LDGDLSIVESVDRNALRVCLRTKFPKSEVANFRWDLSFGAYFYSPRSVKSKCGDWGTAVISLLFSPTTS